MTTTTIGQQTELQAIGGGYFTESYPTNFHHFYTKKALVTGETADMYKDVTASEKTTIEAADAKWVEPSVDLIAAAEAAGAVYNEATGYFELNTLTDITTEQMTRILYSPDCHIGGAWQVAKDIRTNLTLDNPTLGWTTNEAKPLEFIVYGNNTIEVLKLVAPTGNIWVSKLFHAFRGAKKLRMIIGKIQAFTTINAEYAFAGCEALEEVRIGRFYSNLDFSDCPKLSLESLTHMVQQGAPDLTPANGITYTLHPEAYARLTPALISEAATKYITFATIQE